MFAGRFRISMIVVSVLLLFACAVLAVSSHFFPLAAERPQPVPETWAAGDTPSPAEKAGQEMGPDLEKKRKELALALRAYYLGNGSEQVCRRLLAETEALIAAEEKLDK